MVPFERCSVSVKSVRCNVLGIQRALFPIRSKKKCVNFLHLQGDRVRIRYARGKSGLLAEQCLARPLGTSKGSENSRKVQQKVNRLLREVRVKPCGKSARHISVRVCVGKPHWEQDKIGRCLMFRYRAGGFVAKIDGYHGSYSVQNPAYM